MRFRISMAYHAPKMDRAADARAAESKEGRQVSALRLGAVTGVWKVVRRRRRRSRARGHWGKSKGYRGHWAFWRVCRGHFFLFSSLGLASSWSYERFVSCAGTGRWSLLQRSLTVVMHGAGCGGGTGRGRDRYWSQFYSVPHAGHGVQGSS